MTHVQFLHGARDRLASAAAWLGDAYRQGRRVVIYVPAATSAERLDRLLWTQPATGFLPHCASTSALAAETPLVLVTDSDQLPTRGELLNLSDALPPDFQRFEQLTEIVSIEDAVRLPARERFRHYREHGCPVDARDISGG